MDSWEKPDETLLRDKEDFYSDLNMEDVIYANFMHAKRVWKSFKIINLGEIMTCTFKVIHYYLQVYFKTLQTNVWRYMNLILLIFYQHHVKVCLKFHL